MKLDMARIFAVIFLIAGILIAVGPWTIFPVCEYGATSMKCHYTAEAEIVVGVMIALLGLLLAFVKSTETQIVIGVGEAGLGIFAVLISTTLIGMCPATTMECHLLAEPTLKILGAVVVILSLVLVYVAWKKR
jgi:hypothetical protein